MRTTDVREVMNAIFYVLRSGCDWRMLPHDFPKWKTVHHYFRMWKEDGTWKKAEKKKQPSAGIIDSQSVKTTEKRGFVALTLAKR